MTWNFSCAAQPIPLGHAVSIVSAQQRNPRQPHFAAQRLSSTRALQRTAAPLGSRTARVIWQRLLQLTGRFRRRSLSLDVRQRPEMVPLSVTIWALRILAVGTIVFLCFLTGSGIPALALSLVWSPNGLFVVFFMRGALHLPRFLEPVKPIEPVLYRWVGVGLFKGIAATRVWPMVNGFAPLPKPKNRQELLDRTEHMARGAEICHGATFILASVIALIYLAVGRTSEALWILGFNIVLNGYPVMLQRTHRWRLQQVRAQVGKPSIKS